MATPTEAEKVESETDYYMRWLHRPENKRELADLRAQVDKTKYWSVLSKGKTTDDEKNEARDGAIRAAVSHLLTKNGARYLAEDDEHAKFYISLEIGSIDNSDAIINYQTHQKSWATGEAQGSRIGPTISGDARGTRGGDGSGSSGGGAV